VIRLDDNRLTRIKRDRSASPRGIARGNALEKALDVLVGHEVVAGDRKLDSKHLRSERALPWIHFTGQNPPRPRDQLRNLGGNRAAEQTDRGAIELADQPHIEYAGVAVVVDTATRLGLNDERQRGVDDHRPIGKFACRTVMALHRPHHDTADLHDDAPGDRTDLVGVHPSVHKDALRSVVAHDRRACPSSDRSSVTQVIERRVRNEDDIGRFKLFMIDRRESVPTQIRIDQDPFPRADELEPSGAQKADLCAHVAASSPRPFPKTSTYANALRRVRGGALMRTTSSQPTCLAVPRRDGNALAETASRRVDTSHRSRGPSCGGIEDPGDASNVTRDRALHSKVAGVSTGFCPTMEAT
jgi:hypothetical protein